MASESGIRTIAAPWRSIGVRHGGTVVCSGFEARSGGTARPIDRPECIDPQLIFHRLYQYPDRLRVWNQLAHAHPRALLSFHPEFAQLGSKWGVEECLRATGRAGAVPRPDTYLLPKNRIGAELAQLGRRRRLIFKPEHGSRGQGILVSTPGTFDAVVASVESACVERFVVQPIVDDALRLEGRRFDLRVYAFVSSFEPLRYRVFRDGIVKVAAREAFDGADPLSILTNCAYRSGHGAPVHNMTLPELFERLRVDGHRVEGLWDRIDAMAGALFEAFAAHKPLRSAPDLGRYFLVTGLDALLVDGPDGVRPLFLESNYTPLLHRFGPQAVDDGLLQTTRSWLAPLLDRVRGGAVESYTTRATAPDQFQHGSAVRVVDTRQGVRLPPAQQEESGAFPEASAGLPSSHNGDLALDGLASILGNADARQSLLERAAASLGHSDRVTIRSPHETGLSAMICRGDAGAVMDVRVEHEGDLDQVDHPLAGVLPFVDEASCTVETVPWPEARFERLATDLVAPVVRSIATNEEAWLLRYLGRLIGSRSQGDAPGRRYVEPGVGRSYLVDFLRFRSKPEYTDFSVTGVGLTPYSEGGFALKGPHMDGYMPLVRARHRARIGDSLGAMGLRVAETAAVIALDGLATTMPDHSQQAAALLVRGFRTILRVKQLDPVANLLLSDRHRSSVETFLRAESPALGAGTSCSSRSSSGDDVCRCLIVGYVLGTRSDSAAYEIPAEARQRRIELIHRYAPRLLSIAKAKLARELGRHPRFEPLTDREYVTWFAREMGRQLGVMARRRFLHDYRVAHEECRGTSHSLGETNITLLAEIADLDTGILLDDDDALIRDELLISQDEIDALRRNFGPFHALDQARARTVVQTLATVAHRGDSAQVTDAMEQFAKAYELGSRGAPAVRRPRARRESRSDEGLEPLGTGQR